MSNGARVTVPLPTGGTAEGVEVQVDESTERWSEFTFHDGTVMRAKLTIVSAVRVDGHFDQQGNPLYTINATPVFGMLNVPQEYRKKVQ
jgi:hypothetical protein